MMDDFSGGRQRRVRPANYDISPYMRPAGAGRGDGQVLALAVDDPALHDILPEPSDPDQYDGDTGGDNGSDDSGKHDGKQPWYARIMAFLKSLSKQQWLVIGGVALLLVAGITSYILTRPAKTEAVSYSKGQKPVKPTPPPSPVSPLTGLDVSDEDSKRPVIGVMIENSTFARPQSGLEQAGVVYEAIAEAGITRFLALFQEANPGNVGPIRSARPYYAEWAHSYDAGYAHVGGSPDALDKIKADGIRDMDQFYNSGAYHRISQREAPHNVYTGMQNLRDLAAAKDWKSSSFSGWPRKKEVPAANVTAQRIDIAISGPTYSVHYDYDKASNTYLRSMAGEPHKDADSGKQLAPKVVIGIATQYGLMSDGYHSTYTTTGSGTVKIFQDGTVTEGTWKRDSATDQYHFSDSAGKIIALDRGQAWVTVVGDPAAITYAATP